MKGEIQDSWVSSVSQVQEGNLKWSSGTASFGNLIDSQGLPRSALRSLLSEAHEGLYYLEVQAGGQVVGSPSSGPRDSCTFKVGTKHGGMCLPGLRVCLRYRQEGYKSAGESFCFARMREQVDDSYGVSETVLRR